MKILMVNKFLYPNGGSETYMFKLGAYLKSIGHEVEYFGMEHEGRCVSNSLGLYTETMDFHNSSAFKKIKLSLKTIYSKNDWYLAGRSAPYPTLDWYIPACFFSFFDFKASLPSMAPWPFCAPLWY